MQQISIDLQDPMQALKYLEAMTDRLELRRSEHYKISAAIASIHRALAPVQADKNKAQQAAIDKAEEVTEPDSDQSESAPNDTKAAANKK